MSAQASYPNLPPLEPGHIRLAGTREAMAKVSDQLHTLHALLHSPDEDVRLATVRSLARRGIRVVYGPTQG